MPQKPNTTTILQTALLITLCLIASVHLITASIPSTGPFYLEYPFGYTYYVGKMDDDTYFAVRGSDWKSITSTNTTYLIDTIFDDISGGKVLFMDGTYVFNYNFTVEVSNVIIEGEGPNTIFQLNADQDFLKVKNTVENVTLRNFAITNPNGYDRILVYAFHNVKHLTIENLRINAGSSSGATGISVRSHNGVSHHIRIKDNTIKNARDGIHLIASGTGQIYNLEIKDNTLENIGRNSIHLITHTAGGGGFNSTDIGGNQLYGFAKSVAGSGGVKLHAYDNNTITNTNIHDNIIRSDGTQAASSVGIYVTADADLYSQNIRVNIHDNIIVCKNVTKHAIGIEAEANHNNNINISICHNQCHDSNGTGINVIYTQDVLIEGNTITLADGNGPIYVGATVDATIRDNRGFVTENSVSQIVANGENVPHGLAGTPDYVIVTCGNVTYDGVPIVVGYNQSGVDATNIPISVYWTNGTAITDDVIFVTVYAVYEP